METQDQEYENVSPTAKMFAYYINSSDRSQASIAASAGYSRPNVISMFKAGKMKIPLERIPAFAKAMRIDPAPLLRVAMQEYFPAIWKILQEHLSADLLVSYDEQHILEVLRTHAGYRGVKIVTERQRNALRELADSLSPKPTGEGNTRH
jgi:hypothetical protein